MMIHRNLLSAHSHGKACAKLSSCWKGKQMTQMNKLLCIARPLLVAVTKESAELSARAEILAW
jgi:hypothetical protein